VSRDIRDALDGAVRSLPERRRAVFELCVLEGFTYRETAEALEISIKTVENQMVHALRHVREALAEHRGATG
jgi:RNA polymerase sigma-70 factor (ECF subfamily)